MNRATLPCAGDSLENSAFAVIDPRQRTASDMIYAHVLRMQRLNFEHDSACGESGRDLKWWNFYGFPGSQALHTTS
jgi:hypothetical protein